MSIRLTALVTVFNRRERTLAGLASLEAAARHAEIDLHIVLVADGCTDGTVEAVRSAFPTAQVEEHPGGLYWCRGMHLAWRLAMSRESDVYLWFNDDGLLTLDALRRLRDVATPRVARGQPAIVVGSFVDPATGRTTYGGQSRLSRWRPTRTQLVAASDAVRHCDTMNGNLVWVPREVVERIGMIDGEFAHAMGDIDYGFRARAAGIDVLVAPGVVGTCARNPLAGTFTDAASPLRKRWRHMMSPKGLPPASWWRLVRRHGGPLWPVVFIWPYLRVVVSSLRSWAWRGSAAPPGQQGSVAND